MLHISSYVTIGRPFSMSIIVNPCSCVSNSQAPENGTSAITGAGTVGVGDGSMKISWGVSVACTGVSPGSGVADGVAGVQHASRITAATNEK
jgi:hypothetical protein